jgi:hypothetical protein
MTRRDAVCLRLALFFFLLAGVAGYVMWASLW